MRTKRFVRALALALLPMRLARHIANFLGFNLAAGARVGLSWVHIDSLEMSSTSRIGHFNRLSGPFSVQLSSFGSIGNYNTLVRANRSVAVGDSSLMIGVWGKITSRHFLDLTCPISIGSYSTVAGSGCQLWTHGYVHAIEGIDRYRIDGSIVIEDNVYIGSMCFISMGVRIGKGVIVGGGSAVAKDLIEPGLYVSSPLRQLPRPQAPEDRSDLEAIPRHLSEDVVFRKRESTES
jgi:acetyltransferase-like isoleucine patch superfamily enzyme